VCLSLIVGDLSRLASILCGPSDAFQFQIALDSSL
jgi:hypothetical protein